MRAMAMAGVSEGGAVCLKEATIVKLRRWHQQVT